MPHAIRLLRCFFAMPRLHTFRSATLAFGRIFLFFASCLPLFCVVSFFILGAYMMSRPILTLWIWLHQGRMPSAQLDTRKAGSLLGMERRGRRWCGSSRRRVRMSPPTPRVVHHSQWRSRLFPIRTVGRDGRLGRSHGGKKKRKRKRRPHGGKANVYTSSHTSSHLRLQKRSPSFSHFPSLPRCHALPPPVVFPRRDTCRVSLCITPIICFGFFSIRQARSSHRLP